MKAIITTKERYQNSAIKALSKQCDKKNRLALPRIEHVTIHTGIGKFVKERAVVSDIVAAITAITGQKPVMTKAKKSIAGFKVREGQNVGVKVSLRSGSMWSFLDRLIHVVLPRVRDFQGIKISSVDAQGNLNIGIYDHTVFPEIVPEEALRSYGMQITVTTTAQTHDEGVTLFRELGVPLRQE